MIKKLICVFVFSLSVFITPDCGQADSQAFAKNPKGLETQVNAYVKPYWM
jgi:hypothetical protein